MDSARSRSRHPAPPRRSNLASTTRRWLLGAAISAAPALAITLPLLVTSTTRHTTASLTLAPSTLVAVDAVGRWTALGYGRGRLPAELTVTNDRDSLTWYRLRLVDDLADFQIQLDQSLDDPAPSRAGFAAPFHLGPVGHHDSVRTFALGYCTRAARPLSTSTNRLGPPNPDQYHRVRILVSLQRFGDAVTAPPPQDHPGWALVPGATLFVPGKLWRVSPTPVDFSAPPTVNQADRADPSAGRRPSLGAFSQSPRAADRQAKPRA